MANGSWNSHCSGFAFLSFGTRKRLASIYNWSLTGQGLFLCCMSYVPASHLLSCLTLSFLILLPAWIAQNALGVLASLKGNQLQSRYFGRDTRRRLSQVPCMPGISPCHVGLVHGPIFYSCGVKTRARGISVDTGLDSSTYPVSFAKDGLLHVCYSSMFNKPYQEFFNMVYLFRYPKKEEDHAIVVGTIPRQFSMRRRSRMV